LDKYVPKLNPVSRIAQYQKWYISSIITKIKENNKFWNRYRKTKITSHLVDVKKLRRKIRQEVRREYLNFIRAAEDSLLDDPKKFWKFINQKKKATSVPGSMIDTW
jgi:hypothetical protein